MNIFPHTCHTGSQEIVNDGSGTSDGVGIDSSDIDGSNEDNTRTVNKKEMKTVENNFENGYGCNEKCSEWIPIDVVKHTRDDCAEQSREELDMYKEESSSSGRAEMLMFIKNNYHLL